MTAVQLFLLRILFGKFSYHYQCFAIKQNFSNHHRKKYLQSCSNIDGLGHIRSAFEIKREHIVVTTGLPVKFHRINPYQSFRKFIRNNKKFIGYDIGKYHTCYWKRVAYRGKIFNSGVKIIYHFLDNTFFFGEFFFSDARGVDINSIRKLLCEKYSIFPERTEDKFKIYTKEAFIFFEHTGINLSIKYVFTENETINNILKNFVKLSNEDPRVDNKQSFTDLF